MYLFELDSNGMVYKITPNATHDMITAEMVGVLVNELPVTIEELLLTYDEMELDNKKYYIKKEIK
jgi:hypothetical protein